MFKGACSHILNSTTHPTDVIAPHLDAGEKLLWSGQPRWAGALQELGPVGRLTFWLQMVFVGAFSVLFIFMLVHVLYLGNPTPYKLSLLLVVLSLIAMALYTMWREPAQEGPRRAQTFYGVTDRRILLIEGPTASPALGIWYLSVLNDARIIEDERGEGSIQFGLTGPTLGPLREVRKVYDIIRRAQEPTR